MTPIKSSKNNKYLLIVDDDITQLTVLDDILSDEGFQVITVTTAKQAIDSFKKNCFSVAVIDLRLPDLDGTDLLTLLMGLDHRVRVIIHTGYGTFESAKQAINYRAFAYIEKATDPEKFILTIHRAYQEYKENYIRDLEHTVSETSHQLQESEERLNLALESANGVAWDWNIITGEVTHSRNWYQMTGYEPNEWVSDMVSWRACVHPDDFLYFSEVLKKYFNGETDTYECEYRIRTKDNQDIWCLDRGKIIERDSANDPVRMIGINTDITLRKQQEDSLRIAAIAFESHEGISITDVKGVVIRVNQAYTVITGYCSHEIIGETNKFLFSRKSYKGIQQKVWQQLNDQGRWQGEYWTKRKNGEPYLERLNISVVRNSFDKVSHYISHFTDITESEQQQQQIIRNIDEERILSSILQFSFLSIGDFLQQSIEIIISLSWLKPQSKSGIFLHDSQQKNILTLVSSHNLSPELLTLCAKVPFGQCWCGKAAQTAKIQFSACVDQQHEITFPGMAPHGHYNIPIIDGDHILGVMVLYLDHGHQQQDYEISFLKRVADVLSLGISRSQAEQKIEYLAYHDGLTTLPNRLLLIDRLTQIIASNKRFSYFSALMYIDLDRFKNINDSFGHSVGDALLQEVARRFKYVIRQEDTVARLGGDEFVILLTNLPANKEIAVMEAQHIANKLHEAISTEINLFGHSLFVSLSIGVVIISGAEISTESIMLQADTAMYQAKANGRNGTQFFMPEMQAIAHERLVLEKDLRYAIEREQIQVFYQPQMDTKGNVVGAEALIRWEHPQRGFISPVDFIPIAEESDIIMDMGCYVLIDVCQKIKEWHNLTSLKHVAVNVSPVQFRKTNFVSSIQAIIDQTGIDATKLTLELTEGILVDNVGDVIQKMQQLKQLGVHFSIDDFGTGYSSLAYLTKFPLDQLKIDKSFVDDIGKDEDDQIIIETIIAMADRLGLNIIAEGVETREQIQFLEDKGCFNFQGYYFSRPLPGDDFSQKYL